VIIASSPSHKKRNLIIASIIVLVLVSGVATAVYLVQRQARLTTEAWNCEAYAFNVSESGVVTAANNSAQPEPAQQVSITINGQPAGIFNVPPLAIGQSVTVSTVDVAPHNGSFTWEAVGSLDCSDSGQYIAPTVTPMPSPTDVPDTTPSPTPPKSKTPTPSPDTTPSATPSSTPPTTPPIGGDDPSPTPTHTPTPTPTSTPGPTNTPPPGPTNTPGPGPTSTPAPTPVTQIPQSGVTDTTWIVTLGGLALISLGVLFFAL